MAGPALLALGAVLFVAAAWHLVKLAGLLVLLVLQLARLAVLVASWPVRALAQHGRRYARFLALALAVAAMLPGAAHAEWYVETQGCVPIERAPVNVATAANGQAPITTPEALLAFLRRMIPVPSMVAGGYMNPAAFGVPGPVYVIYNVRSRYVFYALLGTFDACEELRAKAAADALP
ncbi:MAG TPA: hypothetical protein VMF62_20130 [Acetobacteraceae bacterium]|nr:hypothetical protein [Acetobacteraceae bacterium]